MNKFVANLLLFCVLICYAERTIAQVRIDGSILDKETYKPVSYASVGIAKTTKGTIANEEGLFILYADSFPVKVVVNAVGYESKMYVIEKDVKRIVIKMIPRTYKTKDVVITANEADLIFKNAFGKLRKQSRFVYKSKAFFRLLTQNDSLHTEMIESFYDTWLGKAGIVNWDMQHGRFAAVDSSQEKRYLSSLDFSIVSRYVNILNNRQNESINYIPFVFDSRYYKQLAYTITDRFDYDGRELVRIDFEPAKKFKGKIHTKGFIYIDEKTFDTYRLVQDFDKWEVPIIELIDPNLHLKNLKVSFDIRFQSTDLNHMLPHLMKVSFKYTVNDKEYKPLHDVNTVTNLLFYDYESTLLNERKIVDSAVYETDYEAISNKLYIQDFWDKNAVLAETPIEADVRKDFEDRGAFGKSFQNSNDTAVILGMNYITWKGRAINFFRLSNSKTNRYPQGKLLLAFEGGLMGEMYGKLYFSWNCYRDTFYFISLPLLDLRETWIEEGEIGSSGTEFIYSCYLDLLEVHKRRLVKQLRQLSDPCSSKYQIKILFKEAQTRFQKESRLMVNECWGGDEYRRMKGCYKWNKYINESLKVE